MECKKLNTRSLTEQFPTLFFAEWADTWLSAAPRHTIFTQLDSRKIQNVVILPLISTAGLGIDQIGKGFQVAFNESCRLDYAFEALGHEIGHTFHFDLTKDPLITIIDQNSSEYFYNYDKKGEPRGFLIEDFCDMFSLKWMAINTKEKVRKECNSQCVLDSLILMFSEASERVIHP